MICRLAKTLSRLALMLLIGLPLPAVTAGAADTLFVENFENGLGPTWQSKSFQGETTYKVVPCELGYCLQADSSSAASGLSYEITFDPYDYPILAWRWKITHTVPGGDARTKTGDDYAARVYVVFPHWFFPMTRSLNYIWANQLPQGDMIPSAYTDNSVMFAVESGPEKAGQWVEVRRNIVEDYRRAFGEEPPMVGAIAIMTDTDNTGAKARAWYDEIAVRRE